MHWQRAEEWGVSARLRTSTPGRYVVNQGDHFFIESGAPNRRASFALHVAERFVAVEGCGTCARATALVVTGVEFVVSTTSSVRSWFRQARSWFSHGTNRTRWPRSSSSFGVVPTGNDLARISPRSLMLKALVICRPEPGAMSLFRSRIGLPSSQTKACRKLVQSEVPPTTWPRELIALPRLQGSPGKEPRSLICPFLQTTASWMLGVGRSAEPAMSPASLIQMASELGPAEGAEIFHPAIAPAEGMGELITGQAGASNDLAAVIGALPEVKGASEISQVGDDAVVPEKRSMVGCPELVLGVKIMWELPTMTPGR